MSRVSQPQQSWVICYDISSARRRRRVSRLLEGEGTRVQRSVFRVEATPDQIHRLEANCRHQLTDTDKLRCYPVGAPIVLPWQRKLPLGLPSYWIA